MRKLLLFACALALLLSGCARKKDEPEAFNFDYSKAAELARAECLPEGARLISEETSRADGLVTVVLRYAESGKENAYKVVYEMTEAYELREKTLLPES